MTTALIPSTLVLNHALSFGSPALLNVLIVNDDRPAREACRQAAASLGCRTTVTDSAEQALCLVGLYEIDVVLLGLNLPDAVRVQVLRQIKQKRRGVEVSIITTNPGGTTCSRSHESWRLRLRDQAFWARRTAPHAGGYREPA